MRYTSALRDTTDRLLIDKVGYPLSDYIQDHRDRGASYAAISEAIAEDTDGIVTVTRHTVREWCLQPPTGEAS